MLPLKVEETVQQVYHTSHSVQQGALAMDVHL